MNMQDIITALSKHATELATACLDATLALQAKHRERYRAAFGRIATACYMIGATLEGADYNALPFDDPRPDFGAMMRDLEGAPVINMDPPGAPLNPTRQVRVSTGYRASVNDGITCRGCGRVFASLLEMQPHTCRPLTA